MKKHSTKPATDNTIERLHEEFKRRIETQIVGPTSETAAKSL